MSAARPPAAVPFAAAYEPVLRHWFGELSTDEALPAAEIGRWFAKDAAFDDALRVTFGGLVQRASLGVLSDWDATPRGRLALLVLIDQMRRNIFRGRPEAFAADPLALAYALDGLRLGHDQAVRPLERVFFYLPLEHAEDLGMQERAVAAFATLHQSAPVALQGMTASYLDFAERHRAVVRRFGRFPHRNVVLARMTTMAEAEFLQEPGAAF